MAIVICAFCSAILGGFFFDTPGFFIGGFIGWFIGFSISEEEKKEKNKKAKQKANREVLAKKKTDANSADSTTMLPDSNRLYVELVPKIIAICITSNGNVEEPEVDMATLIIENEDLIDDKQKALLSLQEHVDLFRMEWIKSKAIFKLKTASIIHQAVDISDVIQKDKLTIILDSLLDTIQTGDTLMAINIVEKIRSKLIEDNSKSSNKDIMENYIMKNGSVEDISTLREMRSNPKSYGRRLKEAAGGSSVMKTAFGVFSGVVAANLLMDAFHQHQLNEALANFNNEINDAGGLNSFNASPAEGFEEASFNPDESYNETLEVNETTSSDNMDSDADMDCDCEEDDAFGDDLDLI